MKKLLLIMSGIFLFLGCSSKDVFIPKKVINKKLKSEDTKVLEDYTKKTLTFKELDLKYVKPTSFMDNGIRGVYVYYDEKGHKLGEFEKLNTNLAAYGTKLLVINKKKVIKLPQIPISATQKGNLIAIVFENNAVGIYDLKENALIYYQEFEPNIITKYLKASPIFYEGLVLFPLLNANIVVYDLKTNSYLKTINLNDSNLISNIIFLKIVNNQLFMATPHELVLFNPNYLIDFKGNFKHILDDGKYLYIFMVGGEVVKLDSNLKVLKKVNLPFADYFAPSVCQGKIYTITSNGYLIEFDKNLNYKVYGGNNFDTSSPLRLKGCKIFNDGKVYFIE